MSESAESMQPGAENQNESFEDGQIGYVDKHGSAHVFKTPAELAQFKEEENDLQTNKQKSRSKRDFCLLYYFHDRSYSLFDT